MKKIWLESYSQGIPTEINPDAYQSLVEMFEESCTNYSNHPAVYNFGITLTYQQIDFYSRAFAAYLQNILKLKKGDRIAVMLPNLLQYPIVIFGALRAGLTVVNVNPLYTPTELIYQLNDAKVNTMVVLSNVAHTVEKALSEISLRHVIVTNVSDLFPTLKAVIVEFVLKYIKKKIPKWHIPNTIKFKEVLAQGEKTSFERVTLTSHDIAFLQYTGGTTGISKGAMLTHRNMLANIIQAEAWFSLVRKLGAEIMIIALPLYHIFSLTVNCLLVVKMGGLGVLITDPRDIPHLISDLKKFKFTAMMGLNTLYKALLKNKKISQVDFSQLKVSISGGMALQHAVGEEWEAVTGTLLYEGYGLTEASPVVAVSPIDKTRIRGSVGLPLSSTEVCILDEWGHELPVGQAGELAVKGPQVMLGYWQKPEETQKVFTKEGWLLTGDIASMDEKGFIRIIERKKDVIIVSGFKVYPNEVEDVLVRMPGIMDVAVIGIPDEKSGESVKLFVVKQDARITADDILRYCREHLTGYKIPKKIEFCQELPKSNIGKIIRRMLKESPH